MARLQKGDNAHIDHINDLVEAAKYGSKQESNDAMTELLEIFKPMMISVCTKWSNYFGDPSFRLKSFDDIMGDCIYWFSYYTLEKHITDGRATYNKFIKDHIDQRIRYIYECELKYRKKYIFPDPYRSSNDSQSDNVFDDVVNKYSNHTESMENEWEDIFINTNRSKLAKEISSLLYDSIFNDRERDIFKQIVVDGKTHEHMGELYGISRTRITQILAKTKKKLYKRIEENDSIWQLLDDAEITITNPKMLE